MSMRTAIVMLAALGTLPSVGCVGLIGLLLSEGSVVQIKLVNDSQSQFVSPNLAVCPNGMAEPPHFFMDSPPVLAPGEEVTYTTGQLAGFDGNCVIFGTKFMIGLCGWSNGPAADNLTATQQRFGGQIGFQFRCGDTVILRWSDTGEAGGSWTSEVQSAAGNEPPTAAFQLL